MPRKPTPYFRQQTQSWYFSTKGRKYPLGKDKTQAFARFHEIMESLEDSPAAVESVDDLAQTYLTWVQRNRSDATYYRCTHYLKSFVQQHGRQIRVAQIKPFHLTQWLQGKDWNNTSQSDAVGVVQRMLNWAVEQGYLKANPVAGFKKPTRKKRTIYYSSEQWEQIKAHATPPFDELLEFLYWTGCRPYEARTLTADQIQGDFVYIPEGKGEKPRVIFLVPEAQKLVAAREGTVFLNSRGVPWTKDAIKCRLTRISESVGFRVIAYGIRHSFATNALSNGVDSTAVAELMGHKSSRMVAEVYASLAHNPEFLRKQARSAVAATSRNAASGSE